jgi:predicted ATPase
VNTVARWERGKLRVSNPERLDAAFQRLECNVETAMARKSPTPLAALPHIVRAPKADFAPHNLPPQLTSFIGREHELAEVGRLLTRSRLLTLTGPAGIGKTRFALQVAAQHLLEYPDGLFFVELASIQDPSQVTSAIAAALQVAEVNGQYLIETLKKRLSTQRRLLILDNCEHLLPACATVAEALLAAAPAVRIIATSREVLRVGAEHVWRVAALSLPESGRPNGADGVERFEAVSLFVERARAVTPAFSLNAANASAVVALCRHLDGIPLAIELAAACSDFLSPQQLLARLDDRFTLLSSGSRAAPARQQSLAQAVEWSCRLLTDSERRTFNDKRCRSLSQLT